MSDVFLFKIKQNQNHTIILQPFWKYLLCNLVALCCLVASGNSTNRNKEGFSLLHVNWNNTIILRISGHFLKNGKTTEACIWPYYDSEVLGFVLICYPNSRPSFFLHPSIHRSTHPSIINSSSTHPFKIRLLWTISCIFSLSASK